MKLVFLALLQEFRWSSIEENCVSSALWICSVQVMERKIPFVFCVFR